MAESRSKPLTRGMFRFSNIKSGFGAWTYSWARSRAGSTNTLDGKVVGMLGRTGHQAKQFGWIYELACPSENQLYVAELLNWRVQKLVLHPERPAAG
jgi:hypothetical protein